MCSENDERIREIWNSNLQFEIGHLQFVSELIEQHYVKKGITEKYPSEIPELAILFPHKPYFRHTEVYQIRKNLENGQFISMWESKNMDRYHSYLNSVNQNFVPSQKIIEQVIERNGYDYRGKAREIILCVCLETDMLFQVRMSCWRIFIKKICSDNFAVSISLFSPDGKVGNIQINRGKYENFCFDKWW
jgi:hypothetical protein